MITRLVWASIRQRPGKSLLLLSGYALGVGVTIALLSIGGALVEQSRDRVLVGGGDLVVLPAGIDLETLKTGGVSSMFFTIEQAPFLYREVLASPRFAGRIEAAAPWIDAELLYVDVNGEQVAVTAEAQIPSLARALGAGPELVAGFWEDVDADRVWRDPGPDELYRSLDALHLPTGSAVGDSTWAEWHYFNVLLPDDRGWLYLTYMIAGEVPDGRWGGRLLGTLVEPGVGERVYSADFESADVRFIPGEPDLVIGDASVSLGPDGEYRLSATVPAEGGGEPLVVDLVTTARSRRYLPPLDLGGAAFSSGYTVPILDGVSTGSICRGGDCLRLDDARTYHDHNWGTWSDVTWDWGQARVGGYSVLYGGVQKSGGIEGSRFLYVADDAGFGGVFTIRDIRTDWSGGSNGRMPEAITVLASTGADSLLLRVDVDHARVTDVPSDPGARDYRFFQLRGSATLTGRLRSVDLSEAGDGFFETWSTSR